MGGRVSSESRAEPSELMQSCLQRVLLPIKLTQVTEWRRGGGIWAFSGPSLPSKTQNLRGVRDPSVARPGRVQLRHSCADRRNQWHHEFRDPARDGALLHRHRPFELCRKLLPATSPLRGGSRQQHRVPDAVPCQSVQEHPATRQKET